MEARSHSQHINGGVWVLTKQAHLAKAGALRSRYKFFLGLYLFLTRRPALEYVLLRINDAEACNGLLASALSYPNSH